jgi:hypothetical protein
MKLYNTYFLDYLQNFIKLIIIFDELLRNIFLRKVIKFIKDYF